MGLKKKLMAQAAAAAAAESAGADDAGVSEVEWTAGNDPLWTIMNEVVPAGALQTELASESSPAKTSASVAGADAAPTGRPKYKWTTSLDTQFKFDFTTALPKTDLGRMCWGRDIVGVMRSEAGAEGVFFVQTTAGAVVLKGSKSMGPEVFASLLGSSLGVHCPSWRVIATSSPEGKAMIAGLSAKDASGRLKLNIGGLTHVLLKAFLPGANFDGVSPERARQIFFNEGGSLSEDGRVRLRELGRILALDVVCNNGDRFPLIWDNRGNPGNVMLARGTGKAVSIDSQVQPIDSVQHREQFEAYLEKVRAVATGLAESNGDVELPQFKRVREKILEFTSVDIGTAGGVELQKGYMELSTNKERISLSLDKLRGWCTAINSYNPPLVGAAGIDPAFVLAVWELL